MRLLTPATFRAQPWKNGGGVTHEILRWPDHDDYDVRISLAEDRSAGPFSLFPGYRRWSFLAGPAPITLHSNGGSHTLHHLGDVLEIDGDVPIECHLPRGPTRLLNFLIRHGLALRPGKGARAEPARFVFALEDTPALPKDCAAVLDLGESFAFDERTIWLG